MCVQYPGGSGGGGGRGVLSTVREGVQHFWGYHEYRGDIMSTIGDIMSTVGDIMSTVGDIMSTVGDILSTMGDTQNCTYFVQLSWRQTF